MKQNLTRYIWLVLLSTFVITALDKSVSNDRNDRKNNTCADKVVTKKEKTLAIIKPDAVKSHYSGDIIKLIELNGFSIIRMQQKKLSKKLVQKFYAVHKNKPFYNDLVSYMTSGPVIVMAIEKENGIKEWRELMGSTDPKKSSPGTLRRMFGTSVTNNAVHGSDSCQTAEQELFFFFPDLN